jgi:hypothetical protein
MRSGVGITMAKKHEHRLVDILNGLVFSDPYISSLTSTLPVGCWLVVVVIEERDAGGGRGGGGRLQHAVRLGFVCWCCCHHSQPRLSCTRSLLKKNSKMEQQQTNCVTLSPFRFGRILDWGVGGGSRGRRR